MDNRVVKVVIPKVRVSEALRQRCERAARKWLDGMVRDPVLLDAARVGYLSSWIRRACDAQAARDLDGQARGRLPSPPDEPELDCFLPRAMVSLEQRKRYDRAHIAWRRRCYGKLSRELSLAAWIRRACEAQANRDLGKA